MTESTAPLLAVDWGTTHFRASLLRPGAAAERREGPWGLAAARAEGFEAVLRRVCGAWLSEPGLRVILSGMVGSREGWRDAGYVACPAGPGEVARALVPLPPVADRETFLVPGLSWEGPEGPDFLRGEETQAFGALAQLGDRRQAVLLLPGTNSKWLLCREGRILAFRTFLTGSLFATLRREGLLAGPGEAALGGAFRSGVARGAEGGGLSHQLFGVRARSLAGHLAPSDMPSHLSGLLLGHEIHHAWLWLASQGVLGGEVHVVAAPGLRALYADALPAQGFTPRLLLEDPHPAGASLLAELASTPGVP